MGIIALMAVIAVPAFAGGSRDRGGAAPGQLTITGLDKYNGLFIKAGYSDTDGGEMYHWHFNKASGDVTAQFTNGTGRGVFVEDN